MTQAPATPELVERLRSRSTPIYAGAGLRTYVVNDEPDALCQEAADALEAQQARIAELEGLNDDLETANAAMFSHVEETVEQYRSAQADRYEKALRDLFTKAERVVLATAQTDAGRWVLLGDGERLAGDLLESVDDTRQALSSQGRHEGGEG